MQQVNYECRWRARPAVRSEGLRLDEWPVNTVAGTARPHVGSEGSEGRFHVSEEAGGGKISVTMGYHDLPQVTMGYRTWS
jgi:hypothetical protein